MNLNCGYCGIALSVPPYRLKKSKSGNVFCNYAHRSNFRKKPKLRVKCSYCLKKITRPYWKKSQKNFFCKLSHKPKFILSQRTNRFWKLVQKSTDINKCWNWIGKKDIRGYGNFSWGKHGDPRHGAHRFSYIIHKGSIPKGKWILHHCDNPLCVNPKHLFIGTGLDNIKDMVSKKRHSFGERNRKAKLKESDILAIINLCKLGDMTRKEIAEKFSVNKSTIYNILSKRSWKHLT